jgi:hypothetical protein
MLSARKISPAQKGAKWLHAQDVERLDCVQYRYDHQWRKQYQTVALMIEEKEWTPPPTPYALRRSSACAVNWPKWNYSAGSSELAVNEIEHGGAGTFATIKSSR